MDLDPSLKEWFDNAPSLLDIPEKMPDKRTYAQGGTHPDPMSPYDTPHSDANYTSIIDVMNRKPFPAIYPQSYTYVPEYYRKFNVTPYFNPGEGEDYAKGVLTVAGMIELTANGQPWALQRAQDMEMIRAIAERYVELAQPYANRVQFKAYLERVHKFIDVLDDALAKAHKNDPHLHYENLDIVQLLGDLVLG